MTSYEDAGVNLSAADELVDRIGWRVTSTWTEDVVGEFGGFAAGIQIPAGFSHPVLMLSTDGVGTKAEVARQAGLLEGLGYDLLATVADDLSPAGAQPIPSGAVLRVFAFARVATGRAADRHSIGRCIRGGFRHRVLGAHRRAFVAMGGLWRHAF